MFIGVSKELELEIRDVLKSLIEAPGDTLSPVGADSPPLTKEAVLYLEDKGVLEKTNKAGNRRLTADGREYWGTLPPLDGTG